MTLYAAAARCVAFYVRVGRTGRAGWPWWRAWGSICGRPPLGSPRPVCPTPVSYTHQAKLDKANKIILKELQTNTPPVDEDGFLGMLDSTTGNLNLIGVLLVVLAGGIIAGEFGSGTVKLLLITPHKRQKIFWAKAVLLLEITGLILAGLFVLSFLTSAA